MKLVITRKPLLTRKPNEEELSNLLNSAFGNTVRVMPDDEVEQFVEEQAKRGFVCYEFAYTGTYQSHTTVIKSQAA